MSGIVDEFKKFAMKGNVVDLAVGVIIGGAFGKIVASLVEDVIMPPLGVLIQGIDFSNIKIRLTDSASIHIGKFINQSINFVLVAFAVFLLVKAINAARERFEEREAAAEAAKPTVKTRQEELLEEIRDLLKKR